VVVQADEENRAADGMRYCGLFFTQSFFTPKNDTHAQVFNELH
jgi:hypothetical protein